MEPDAKFNRREANFKNWMRNKKDQIRFTGNP